MPPMVDGTRKAVRKQPVRYAAAVALTLVSAVSAIAFALVSGGQLAAAQEPMTILYTSESSTGGGQALFTILPDGTGRAQLPSSLQRPAAQGDWSPDRTHVAYTSYNNEEWRLHVLDVAGNSNLTITTGPEDFEPDWSPDGSRILFTSYFNRDTVDQTSFLMTTEPDGANTRPIVQLINPNYFIGNPRWSPDGSRIAFTLGSAREGGELYAMNADGTNIRVLLDHPGWDDIDPTWSPDGMRIAFASGEYGGTTGRTRHEIWLLDVALGVAGTIIVDDVFDLRRPAWSSDGRWIVFDALGTGRDSAHDLHVAPSTGGPIGDPIAEGREPDWGAGGMAPTTTPISPPSATGTTTPAEPSPTPDGSATMPPPPITQIPTIPPFPTISTPGPTSTGPAPTFPPPTDTPTASSTPTSTVNEPSATATPTATATASDGDEVATFLPVAVRNHHLDGE